VAVVRIVLALAVLEGAALAVMTARLPYQEQQILVAAVVAVRVLLLLVQEDQA